VARRESAITLGRYRTGSPRSAKTKRRRALHDAIGTVVVGGALAIASALALDAAHPADGWRVAVAAVVGVAPAGLAAAAVLRRKPMFSTPADRVTLARAALASGCAAMTALVVLGPAPARNGWLFGLTIPMLLLDALDGVVARRTGTVTDEGGGLDMQVDAGILAVLSAAVATELGWWVLLIGGMRYAYVVASWARPGLASPLARSRFRVVVAALQGVVLAGALAPFVPTDLAAVAVATALVLLTASFVAQIRALQRLRVTERTRI
jgi:phosphatidylglycerophosphate synthase